MESKRVFALVQLCAFLGIFGVESMPTGTQSKPILDESRFKKLQPMIARACNRIALGVYREVAINTDNVVLSPISMCTLLAVCFRSAGGKTLNELRDSLLLELADKREMSAVYGSIHRSFSADPLVNITTSNVMFVNKNFQLVNDTASDYKESYNGTVRTFDPENKDLTSANINDLVSSGTKGLVEGDLKADDISSGQGLFLVNTLHLNARWKDMFDNVATHPMTYHPNSTTEILVPTMYRRGLYRWNRNNRLRFDILEIPYEGGRFAMYIILPREKDGLERLEEELTPERSLRLEKAIANMKNARETDLYLPKFSITQSFSLKEALKKNSVNLLFDEKSADLSALIKGRNVYIKEAFHQSAIEVTERGTVAGSYSRFVGYYYSALPTFHASHPFLYVLRDTQTGFNVFMGKFTRP